MMTQNTDKKREQIIMLCMDDMVPQDHLSLTKRFASALFEKKL